MPRFRVFVDVLAENKEQALKYAAQDIDFRLLKGGKEFAHFTAEQWKEFDKLCNNIKVEKI